MRMWLVSPGEMCRRHLLGEHVELHMFLGSIAKGNSLEGYVSRGFFQADKLVERHEDLVKEMIRRGYRHNSLVSDSQKEMLWNWMRENPGKCIVDSEISRRELASRCEACRNLRGRS